MQRGDPYLTVSQEKHQFAPHRIFVSASWKALTHRLGPFAFALFGNVGALPLFHVFHFADLTVIRLKTDLEHSQSLGT